MYIDTVTIGAFVLILVIFTFVVFINMKKSQADRDNLRNLELALERKEDLLERRIEEVSRQALIPSEEARHLCCAVRRIYPSAQVGLDFHVADEGEGPFIKHWMMEVPAPSEEQIASALDQHHQARAESRYQDLRVASYPSISDQLDAMYKARRGRPDELSALDARIKNVKCRYPKPGDCERDCD